MIQMKCQALFSRGGKKSNKKKNKKKKQKKNQQQKDIVFYIYMYWL